MFSDMFVKLWQQNLFLLGVWQTIYLTVISTVFAYVLGLPLGLLLCVSDKDGIHPMPVLNKILSILINAFRSVPFIILATAQLHRLELITRNTKDFAGIPGVVTPYEIHPE